MIAAAPGPERSQEGASRRGFLIGSVAAAVAAPIAGRPAPASASASGPSGSVPGLGGAVYRRFATSRHRTAYIEAGPVDGPLMIFLHGWPHMGLTWRPQLAYFAARGWRCVAPDLRGYGGSSVPTRAADYGVREVVADMVELHDGLGGKPAVWVGHSLGCTVVWALATQHAARCCGGVNLTVPHLARGNALPFLTPLIDRKIYPADRYPLGQWDYIQFYAEHFTKAVRDFESRVGQTLDSSYLPGSPDAVGKPTPLANIRAQGGWFPAGSGAPPPAPVGTLLPAGDRQVMLAAFTRNGFSGPCAWYLNDAPNIAYAAEAPDLERVSLPCSSSADNGTRCATRPSVAWPFPCARTVRT